jgi:death-on-curing protein
VTLWPDVAIVVALHETIMRRMGWSAAPLRDEGALASAIMRPQMAAHYEAADLVRQAALLAVGISQAQAFLDGNKRTAFATLKLFLDLNGWDLAADPLDVARELERVAEGEDRRAAEAAFEAWLREAVADPCET